MRSSILCVLAVALSASTVQAQSTDRPPASPNAASDWTFNVGAAVIAAPRYVGSSSTRIIAIPTFDIKYRDWLFINPVKGVGAEVELLEGLKGSASIAASLSERKAKDDARFKGLGDIGAAAAIRLGLEYELGNAFVSGKLMSRLGSSNGRGTLFEAEAGYNVWASREGVLGLGLQAKAMDSKYAQNFFGVTAGQAVASGLQAFEAGSGLQSAGPFAQLLIPISKDWTFFSRAEYMRLRGDAAASPITQKRGQTSLFATVSRSF